MAAVWDQAGARGQAVYAVLSTDGGRTWSDPRRLIPPGENASYPRVVAARDWFLAIWTVHGAGGEAALRTQALR